MLIHSIAQINCEVSECIHSLYNDSKADKDNLIKNIEHLRKSATMMKLNACHQIKADGMRSGIKETILEWVEDEKERLGSKEEIDLLTDDDRNLWILCPKKG